MTSAAARASVQSGDGGGSLARRRLLRAPITRPRLLTAVQTPGLELISQAAPWVGLLVGSFLVTVSYSWAASHSTGMTQFTLFWAGLFAFVLPCTFRLGRQGLQRNEQIVLVLVTALFFFLPKVLRSPSGPIYADELAHWRQTEVLFKSGRLFAPNPFISIANGYPGFHALSDALRTFSGLSTWGVAVLLVALLLCLNVLGVFQLVEQLFGTRTPRAPGFAALIYACSSGFMFFDSQYAYESLGLPLLIWVLVALAHLLREDCRARDRLGWLTFAGVLCLALIVTHHLSAIFLCGALVAASIVAIVQRRRSPWWTEPRVFRDLLGFTLSAVAATVIWAHFAAPKLIHYLSPKLTGGISELAGILQHKQGSRQLFALNPSPRYEHLAAFGAPVVAGVLVLVGLLTLLLLSRRRLSALAIAVVLLGLAYFPSVPFILTTSGAEGARRSWNFSYIGVAALAGLACDTLLDRRWGILPSWVVSRVVPVVLPLSIALILLGNVSAGLNVEYRFPGAYVFGSDTRSLTAETRGAVNWFDTTQGTGQRVVADRQDGIAFGSLGLNWWERAYDGLPLWQFYFQVQRPDRGVFGALDYLHDRYLIVDTRIPRFLPRTGVYVVGDEPGAHEHLAPPPAAALAKYDVTPWTSRIYSSNNLQILRLDIPALGDCTDQAPEPGSSFANCRGRRR